MSASERPKSSATAPRRSGRALLFVVLGLGVAALALLDLALGSARVPLAEVVAALFGSGASRPGWQSIVLEYRLPKALTATLAGASLAVSGLLMQTLFRNPLAGPYVLGISSGASLGVALVLLGVGAGSASLLAGIGLWGELAVVAAAGAGAMLTLGLVLVVARRVPVLTLLVLGMLLGYATSAVVTVLLHFSQAERIGAYVRWTFGSFGSVGWRDLWIFAPATLLGLALAQAAAKPLDALLLGEAQARTLGVAVAPVRTLVLVATALLAGTVTAFCGPVGFLGVAVPHLARGLYARAEQSGGGHRVLVPATALLGAAVALAADILAQLPGRDAVLPLNAVTALLGAPIIAVLVLRRRSGAFFG